MKKNLFCTGFFLSVVLSVSQTANLTWVKQMGGTSNDQGRSIATDASGNVYTTGSFAGTADFDPGAGIFNLISAGGDDIFVSKLDATGNFVWAIKIGGGAGNDVAYGIVLDALGNVCTTGSFSGLVDFDPGVGVSNLNSNTYDTFVSKLDASGNFVWAKQFTGLGTDAGNGIAVDPANNVYTTGYFQGTVDFDPGVGISNLVAAGGSGDIFVSKLDVSGNFVWAKRMSGTSTEIGASIAVDGTGNVYSSGYFQGSVDFDPGAGIFNFTSQGLNDIFISKLDALGNFVWAIRTGSTGNDWSNGIALDASGNVFATGTFNGIVDFDPYPTVFNLSSSGFDSFISKLDPAGVLIFAKKIGGGFTDIGYSVTTDALGNVYGTGSYTDAFGTQTEIYIHKYDVLGNFIWAKSLLGTLNDVGFGITVDAADNVYTTGTFQGTVDFDPNAGIVNLTSAGSTDICVHKMSQCAASSAPSNSTPPANLIICQNQTSSLNATGTSTINWYATSTSTSVLGSGLSFTTPTLSTGSYTYFASTTNTCGAESSRTGFTITVNANPTITVNSGSICSGNSFTITPSGGSTYTFQGGSAIQTPTATTSYTVVGTSTAGCVSSAFATSNVTVNATPTITVNSGSICSGISFTIVPSGASTYTFQGGGAVKTPTATTSYTVTGTSAGCVSSSFATSNVTVNATPTITVNSGSICSGNSFTITPSGASTYTFQGGGAVKTPTANASYTVVGTSSAGCVSSSFATSSVTVTANPTITVNSGSICSGNSFTIIPSGASTYTFQGGGAVKTPTATTSYTVAGTSAVGCVSSSFATSNVTVNATPTITVNSGSICSGNSFTIVPSGASTYTFQGGGAVKTPTATTSYTVVGTTAGCVSSSFATSNITVNATPTITVNSGSICSGNSFTITPSGASTYTFQGGGGVKTPTANASYTVVGTSIAGCVSSSFATSNVTVSATPTITIAGGAICPGNSFTLNPSGANTYTFSSGSPVVSPTVTTTYSVTGTSVVGCVSSISAVTTVTVAGTLTITISGNNTVCFGQPISLTAGGATTYTWNTGATTTTIAPTPTVNSTYSVTGASGSCSNTAITSITVNTLPTINAATNNTLLCVGQSASLTASGATTYTWNPGGTGTTISVSPTVTANYTITGTDANGCANSTAFTQSVSACTGLAEVVSDKQEIIAYPNPAFSTLTIKTEETIETITVYNLLGTLVLEEKSNSFSVEQLPAGVYTLLIKTVNGIGTVRFVKE